VVDAIDSLRDFHAEDRIANKRLDAECDALARDIAESEKLRDELREKLSAAIGHASDIIALQDLEGEAVKR
jgi:anti-sigma factor RsiW